MTRCTHLIIIIIIIIIIIDLGGDSGHAVYIDIDIEL